jgi:colanic acid/amylovoran biosynthesis glycosyltransferase
VERKRTGLHLLEVSVRWPPETFLGWKLSGLAGSGFRVTVASPSDCCDKDHRLPGVRLIRLPDWEETRPRLVAGVLRDTLALLCRSPSRLPRVVRAARRTGPSGGWATLARLRSYLPLARLRPDVVHFEWNSAAIDYMPLYEVWGCPTVASCHGGQVNVSPHGPGNGTFGRDLAESFRRLTAVHCVSEAVLREAGRYGLDGAKARLIRPAVDPAFFRPLDRPRGEERALRIVAVGWLRWLKGYEYALQALQRLVSGGVPARLDIVGADPTHPMEASSDTRRVLHTVEDLGLADHVTLHGAVTSEEVRALLHESHVLLHASLTEGIPTVVLEAMACELPVVVTDCGGLREAVTDGREGLVVPPRSPDRMASALERLWRDPDLRRAMGRAGRARVRESFSLDDQVRSFAAMYEEVTAG